MMKFLRSLLLPFSLLYALALSIRHFLYDKGLVKSTGFDVPVIVVGNLIVGGAGKSPMTEYLVKMLAKHAQVAILSRGYGRATSGFRLVSIDSVPKDVGDEPLQMKRKFPHISVAVCENRVIGVESLREAHDVVVLDDAFQHRALKGGFQILLFNYQSLFQPKWVLPAGDYRDLFARRAHADVIVITKCPPLLDEKDKKALKTRLALPRSVPVFFSYIRYGHLTPVWNTSVVPVQVLDSKVKVLLVTGIAQPAPLVDHLLGLGVVVQHMSFADHHDFTAKDISKMINRFSQIDGENKVLLTTEKDAVRLKEHDLGSYAPFVYYLPIEHGFFGGDGSEFDNLVNRFIEKSKTVII